MAKAVKQEVGKQKPILKGYRTELRPTRKQAANFAVYCAVARKLYNWILDQRKAEYEPKRDKVIAALGVLRAEKGKRGAKARKKRRAARKVVLKLTNYKGGEIPGLLREMAEYDAAYAVWKNEPREKQPRPKRPRGLPEDPAKRHAVLMAYENDLKAWRTKCKQLRNKGRPRRPSLKIRMTTYNDLKKRFRRLRDTDPAWGWVRQAPSCVVDTVFMHAKTAYKNFFERLAKGVYPPGFPSYKDWRRGSSFTVIRGRNKKTGRGGLDIGTESVEVTEKGVTRTVKRDYITIPKNGRVYLKEQGYVPTGCNSHMITITRVIDRWFVSVLGEFEPEQLPKNRPETGIDMGLKWFAILATRCRIDNPQYAAKYARKLLRLQKRYSRTKKGSRNREKARIKLARQHLKVRNARRDFMHKLTTSLIREFGRLVVETLGVKDMMQVHTLAGQIADVAWYEFRRQLVYKGKWYGTVVDCVDRFYPSTQNCSRCGMTTRVDWTTRLCTCDDCGLVIDMDDAAASNLASN